MAVADWFEKGVPSKSLVEEWKLSLPPAAKEGVAGGVGEASGAAVASDGRYLYLHGPLVWPKLAVATETLKRYGHLVNMSIIVLMYGHLSLNRVLCTR